MPDLILLRTLARSFLSGELGVEQIVSRLGDLLGKRHTWFRPLATRYVAEFANRTRPRLRNVVQFLSNQKPRKIVIRHWLTEPQLMQPLAAAKEWDLPAIESAGALTEWFRLNQGELEWYADLKALGSRRCSPRLRHYHYRILAKPMGGVRLIEAPKPRLKHLQRQVLTRILDRVPPHPAVHGFVKGRSIKTFVAPHVGKRVVLSMDLRDYFPSFQAARIQAFFRTLGYPESVADLLGGVCTNAAPRELWSELREARELYRRPHLPQGAPTSPSIANVCTWRMDCRLSAFAEAAGAEYTRYADDLAFSGDEKFEMQVRRFSTGVAAILMEEGFSVNHRKTRIMRKGARQHLAGLVINQTTNIRRADFDILKAILTNCVRNGAEGQNRAQLLGRVAFVEMVNPGKALRLRRIFDQITWDRCSALK